VVLVFLMVVVTTLWLVPVPRVYVKTLSPVWTAAAPEVFSAVVRAGFWAAEAMTLLEIAEADATGHTVVVRSIISVTVAVAVASLAGHEVTF
jgi:hypothetical protein